MLGAVLRTLRWWPPHSFRGVLEYDDGVYYAASRLLLHGQLPYSDVTIVHPPGLSLFLLPAALVGEWLGDATGMAAGRVEVLAVAVANTALVHRLALLLPGATARRALLAAGLYAVMPGAVSAEQTILLEPLATCACLVAGVLLLRRPVPTAREVGLAGVLLAVGVGFKLFAGAYVVAAVAYLLWRRLPGRLLPLAAGGVAGAVAVFVPFFVADPSVAWHDIVVTQLNRPHNPTVPQGLHRLVSMVGLKYAAVPLGLLLLAVLVVSTARAMRAGRPERLGFWAVVLVLMGVAFMTSPTYFLHYGEFVAAPVVLLASRLPSLPRLAFAVAFLIGTGALVTDLRGQDDLRAATASVRPGDCVYFDAVSLALSAEVYRLPSAHCPSYVDGRGVALTQNPDWDDSTSFYPAGFVADRAWQAAAVAQMSHADWLLLRHSPKDFPEWDAQTRRYALTHFTLEVRETGGRQPFELWRRTTPG